MFIFYALPVTAVIYLILKIKKATREERELAKKIEDDNRKKLLAA
jgi:hypothetical protein